MKRTSQITWLHANLCLSVSDERKRIIERIELNKLSGKVKLKNVAISSHFIKRGRNVRSPRKAVLPHKAKTTVGVHLECGILSSLAHVHYFMHCCHVISSSPLPYPKLIYYITLLMIDHRCFSSIYAFFIFSLLKETIYRHIIISD